VIDDHAARRAARPDNLHYEGATHRRRIAVLPAQRPDSIAWLQSHGWPGRNIVRLLILFIAVVVSACAPRVRVMSVNSLEEEQLPSAPNPVNSLEEELPSSPNPANSREEDVPTLMHKLATQARPTATCANPEWAKHRISSDFKYGCFCGKNYPGYQHASGKRESDLNRQERIELAAQYYATAPYDDLDAACQAHDVCWLLSGGSEFACNEMFVKSLDELSQGWQGELAAMPIRWKFPDETAPYQWRCSNLASDVRLAASTVVEGSQFVSVARVVSAPRDAALPLIGRLLMGGAGFAVDNFYPHEGEKCSASGDWLWPFTSSSR